MATTKAAGYTRQATSTSAGQPVITRHDWDCAIVAALDVVTIGRLAAGHQLDVADCELFANGLQAAMNVDVCVGSDANVLFDGADILATTFFRAGATTYQLGETLGVDYTQDRDIYLLINSGGATAPAGGKVTLKLSQYPVPQ